MTAAHAQKAKETLRIPSYPVPDGIPEGTYNVTTKNGKKVATQIPGFAEKRTTTAAPDDDNNDNDNSEFKTDLALWLAIIALILASIVFGSWVRDALRKSGQSGRDA